MMKSTIFATLLAGAAAFAPASQQKASTALSAKADFANEIGVQAPLGLWDPFNVLGRCDQAEFDRLRALEIKHGRVAMLAVVGYLTTYGKLVVARWNWLSSGRNKYLTPSLFLSSTTLAGVRFPGLEDAPSGFAAFDTIRGDVMGQFGLTLIFMEMANRDNSGTGEFPGDFRNGYLDFGWDSQTAEWKEKKRAIELNQGRAAQMGILGLMVHEKLGNVDLLLPLAK